MLPIISRKPVLFSVIATTLFLSGCASQQQPAPPATIDAPTEALAAETVAAPEAQGSFEAPTLYALLVAELAGHRGLPQVTLHNYLQEAQRTLDPGVARRAVQIAAQLRDVEAMLAASTLWAQAEPDNPAPYRIATKELIKRGRVDDAAPLLERALKLEPLEVIDTITTRADKMTPEERQRYLALVEQMLDSNPESTPLLYTKAALLASQESLDQALALTQQALSLTPDFERAILLEADLQSRMGHLDTALGHLREELGNRDSKQMRTLYTRLLLEKEQYQQAEQQAQILIDAHPDDNSLHFYLGVLMLEHNRLALSERLFNDLAETSGPNSALSYYQGRIAQLQNRTDEALQHYQLAGDQPYLQAAYGEIGNLLDASEQTRFSHIFAEARAKYPDHDALLYAMESAWLLDHELDQAAMALLNEALEQHPENGRLLYSRAMLGEKLGNMQLLEQDLRHLLELEPDNATALNALGYSLTDNTDRHQEALELIKRALALKPDDPAILDSMGWAYYKLGNTELALEYLQRAFAHFPDPEVAAHLGTVHWALGNKTEAMQVWQEALEQDPGNEYILDAMEAAGRSQAKP